MLHLFYEAMHVEGLHGFSCGSLVKCKAPAEHWNEGVETIQSVDEHSHNHLSASPQPTQTLCRECADTIRATFSNQYHCCVWPRASCWQLYSSQWGSCPLTTTASWPLGFLLCVLPLILWSPYSVRGTQLEEVSEAEKVWQTINCWTLNDGPCSGLLYGDICVGDWMGTHLREAMAV